MFGQNPIRKRDHVSASLRVQEIFHTIQGEGPFTGMPAVFLRLAGCNLKCHFCFVGNTRVRMGDGSNRKIKDVSVGDYVLSYSTERGMFEPARVTKVMESSTSSLVRVMTGGGCNETDKVFCTPDHLFLVRGKGWMEASQLTPGDRVLHLGTSEYKRIFNPAHSQEVKDKMAEYRASPQGKALRKRQSDRMRRYMEGGGAEATSRRMRSHNPMKDPATVVKAYLRRIDRGHKTVAETAFESIVEGLPIRFVGSGDLVIRHKIPDFVVEGQKKLIEVWSSDALHAADRGAEWQRKRAALFAKDGYQTLFIPIPPGRQLDRQAVLRQVSEFVHNGDTVVSVDTIDKGSKSWVALTGGADVDATVYNLEVEGNHTYLANGKVVHNCDTDFESNYDNVMPYADVIFKIRQAAAGAKTHLLVITGGEPMLQNFVPIIRAIGADDRWHTQIETAGTLWLPGLEDQIRLGRASLVCSPKTPKVHPLVVLNCRHWKYIVRDTQGGHSTYDGLPCKSTQSEERQMLYRPPLTYSNKIYLQPCDEGTEATRSKNTELAAALCMTYGYRLCLQLHKLVGLP